LVENRAVRVSSPLSPPFSLEPCLTTRAQRYPIIYRCLYMFHARTCLMPQFPQSLPYYSDLAKWRPDEVCRTCTVPWWKAWLALFLPMYSCAPISENQGSCSSWATSCVIARVVQDSSTGTLCIHKVHVQLYIFQYWKSVLIGNFGGGRKYARAAFSRAPLCSAVLRRRHSRDFWDQVQARLVTIKRKNGTNRRRIASVSQVD
jgi:hypothetical protein